MPEEDTSWSWSELDRTTRAVLALILFASIILMVLLLPEPLAQWDAKQEVTGEQINATRRTLVQFLGGFAVLFGLYLTARRIRASERRAEALEDQIRVSERQVGALEDQIRVSEQGQVTERFTRAIEQLGSDTLQIRLGGIYSLERIAKDSDDDYQTVMEVLCAFVRQKTKDIQYQPTRLPERRPRPNPQSPSEDVHAAMLTISSLLKLQREKMIRDEEDPFPQVNLRGVRLRYADLSNTFFQNVDLSFSDLQGTLFKHSELVDVVLKQSNLRAVDFSNSALKNLDCISEAELKSISFNNVIMRDVVFTPAKTDKLTFIDADLNRVSFKRTRLGHSDFSSSSLQNIDFTRALMGGAEIPLATLLNVNFEEAKIRSSDFGYSVFKGCSFRNAKLDQAIFEQASLNECDLTSSNMTSEQICSTNSLYGSDLDSDTECAVREKCPELLEPPAD